MKDPSPAPVSISTVTPEPTSLVTASGMAATRRSFGAISLGTPMINLRLSGAISAIDTSSPLPY